MGVQLQYEGIQEHASRETLWSGIRMEPPRVPECPWSPVIRKAVSTRRDERYPSAQALVRALEEVTLRAGAYENKSPYPGLASFTESEAEYFYSSHKTTQRPSRATPGFWER